MRLNAPWIPNNRHSPKAYFWFGLYRIIGLASCFIPVLYYIEFWRYLLISVTLGSEVMSNDGLMVFPILTQFPILAPVTVHNIQIEWAPELSE